jgi:HEAT repeat protein
MGRAALWIAAAVVVLVAGLAVSRVLTRVESAPAVEPGQTVEPAAILPLIEELAAEEHGRYRPAHERLVEIGQPAVPYLAVAVEDPRRDVRWRTVQALGEIGGDDVVASLVAALQDEDALVRRYAVQFVGKWGKGNAAAIPAVRSLLADPDLQVIVAALSALDELGDTSHKADVELVDSLCAKLRSDNLTHREGAAIALGMTGNPRAAVPLAEALAVEPSRSVRRAIVEAIGKIGSRASAPLFLDLLKDGKPSAAEALRLLGDPSLNDDLLELTRSPDTSLRAAAVHALGFEGNSGAVARLWEVVSDTSEDRRIREQAARGLVEIGDPRGAPAIGVALADEDSYVRRATARALRIAPLPAATPYLLRALEDPEPYVVMSCTYALAHIGDQRAALPLFHLFDREDAYTRALAANISHTNIATAAHRSLLLLMGETPGPHESVRTREQLQQVREMWRQRLGIAKDK